jgi:peptidylprolyl isomerase
MYLLQAAKGKRVTTMRATLDGVNAPLTVGNFKDLATRGFYNGVPVTFIDESTVMTGLPKGKAVRF